MIGKEYPCINCIAIPGGCYDLCDKVEINEEILKKYFNKYKNICPDCCGSLVQHEYGKLYSKDIYYQCDYCKHCFIILYIRKKEKQILHSVYRQGPKK